MSERICSIVFMSKPTVLVTGGAARIGASIVRAFADAGWHCIIHYRGSDEDARALAGTLPSAEIAQCDLSDGDAAVAMVEELANRHDNWRMLINNASIFSYDNATGLDPATNKEAMQVNAETPTRMAQAFLAQARSDAGRTVIHITDQKLENSNPDFFSYTMSKHALDASIAMLADGACGPSDRVYGIAPGAILASHDQTEDEIEVSHRLNPLQRKTEPEEIAAAAMMLAKGHLRNGETVFIDSGQHLLDQPRDVIYLAREIAERSAQ